MHIAVQDIEALRLIIDEFNDRPKLLEDLLTSRMWYSETPLHCAARGDNESLKVIIETFKGKPELQNQLLSIKNDKDQTPLYFLEPEKQVEIENIINNT